MRITISTLLLLIASYDLLACSCIPVSLENEVEREDAIFCGVIEKIERHPAVGNETDEERIQSRAHSFYKATFRVYKPLKGNFKTGDLIEVFSYPDGAACGTRLNFHEPYIVYASEGEMGLGTGLCSRTREISSYSPMRANESYEEWTSRREDYKREIEEEILLIPLIVDEQTKSNKAADTTATSRRVSP